MKKNIKLVILLLCLLALIFIIRDIFSNDVIQYDMDIYNYISGFINDNNTHVVKFITNLGSSFVLILITLLVIVFVKKRKFGILIGGNLGVVVLLNNLLKIIIKRDRPLDIFLIDEVGYSFPSGHAMVSMAFYGFIIYLIYKYVKNNYLKWGLIIFNIILIICIGMSRIYLGVHYASDIMGGFLIGLIYVIIYINCVKKYFVSD